MNRNGSDLLMISSVRCLNLYTISANHETADIITEEKQEMSSHFHISISCSKFHTTKICAAEHGEVTAASNLWIKDYCEYLLSVFLKQTTYWRFMGEKSGMKSASLVCRLIDWLMIDGSCSLRISPINYKFCLCCFWHGWLNLHISLQIKISCHHKSFIWQILFLPHFRICCWATFESININSQSNNLFYFVT